MIFDVARAFHFRRCIGTALEFMEDRPMRFAHHLREHIQATAMGHAEHDFLHAESAATLDDLLQSRNHGFAAIKTEALRAGIFDIDELLETFCLDKFVQNGPLPLAGEGNFLVRPLDTRLNPGFFGWCRDMHELPAQRRAIGAPQNPEHFADCRIFETEHEIDEDFPVPISINEAV